MKKEIVIETAMQRMECLYQEAVSNYLNKNDFDLFEWLPDEKREEYKKCQVI